MLIDYADHNSNIILLNFNSFLDRHSGLLDNQFSSYKNPRHPVHLGRQGILKLGNMFKDCVLRRQVDGRGYSAVLASRAYAFPAMVR